VCPKSLNKSFKPLPEVSVSKIGAVIFKELQRQEDRCQATTLARMSKMGEKSPRCFEMTQRVIALLDCLSCCGWGCSNGDHVLERLLVRSVNHARAALRLYLMGFYDESLVLTRGIGEIANLLSLFTQQNEAMARWKSLSERERRREFAPYKVREQLEAAGTPMRITTELYGELSSKNVHVTPETVPQAFDWSKRGKAGAFYQDAGFLVCQNELATALTFLTYGAASLAHLDKPFKKRLFEAGRNLISNAGRLGVENLEAMWTELTSKTGAAAGKAQ
jgi:hypothetical protein